MEPYRPVIDWAVWHWQTKNPSVVNSESKRALIQSMYMDLVSVAGVTPVMVSIQKLATSLAQVFLGDRAALDLPHPGVPQWHMDSDD